MLILSVFDSLARAAFALVYAEAQSPPAALEDWSLVEPLLAPEDDAKDCLLDFACDLIALYGYGARSMRRGHAVTTCSPSSERQGHKLSIFEPRRTIQSIKLERVAGFVKVASLELNYRRRSS